MPVKRPTVQGMLAAAILCGGALLAACDSTVVNTSATDWNIVNGTAFDMTTIDPAGAEALYVPEDTIINPSSTDGKIHVYLKKVLNWRGHPTLPTDIHFERHKMGCAYRHDGEAMTLATWGEYYGKEEGGATISLAVVVPPGLKVEMKKGLSGPDNPVEVQDPIFDSLQSKEWQAGWLHVKEVPDKSLGAGNFK